MDRYEQVNDSSKRLARALVRATQQQHLVSGQPWEQEHGKYAFDVELLDETGAKTGVSGRIVVWRSSGVCSYY